MIFFIEIEFDINKIKNIDYIYFKIFKYNIIILNFIDYYFA